MFRSGIWAAHPTYVSKVILNEEDMIIDTATDDRARPNWHFHSPVGIGEN